jgi:hypothetical protein
MQLLGDRSVDAFEIAQNLVVPEAEDGTALAFQECASRNLTGGLLVVLAAVDFHDQPGLVTDEIGDVTAQRHLTPELVPVHLVQA